MELLLNSKKEKESFADKHGHNILRVFDILTKVPFTASEMKRDYK